MFFLFPLAHESQSARRWPLVTIGLIALCVVFFLVTTFGFAGAERAVMAAVDRVSTFEAQHSDLALECDIDKHVRRAVVAPPAPAELDDPVLAEHDALCRAVGAAVRRLPAMAYGDIPARRSAVTLLTHQFLHGGWLHLIFNLWFLWLCGVNLEDRWGRWPFLGFYLCAGAAGALLHRALAPDAFIPVIGASGAIAGAMGAFLVTLARTRITFAYALLISFRLRAGTFQSPAYVMLPLWLGSELLAGWLTPRDGTAHWAHVGGFAFGAVVAAVLKLSGVDARLDDMNERKVTTLQDPRSAPTTWTPGWRCSARRRRRVTSAASSPPTSGSSISIWPAGPPAPLRI
jgi:membrane associated rhomboid family serine protease